MKPRVYVYRITFKEAPNYYLGWHLERKYEEPYTGSPKTNKHYWDMYAPVKEILKFFENTDEGVAEALKYEKELILYSWNDELCLNRNVGGIIHPKVTREYWSDPGNRERHSKAVKNWREENPWFVEKLNSMRGESHPGYGTIWITDGTPEGNVRIALGSEVPEGYVKGMTKNPKMEDHPHLGSKWATNGTREGNILIRSGQELPNGYRWGRHLEQDGPSHPLHGKMWITNGTIDGNRLVARSSGIPEGFRTGRIYPLTGEKHFNYGKIWVTNGEPGDNKMMAKGSELPEGYYPGYTPRLTEKTHHTKGTIWITDETTGENKRVPIDYDIPKGFRKGRSHKSKKTETKANDEQP